MNSYIWQIQDDDPHKVDPECGGWLINCEDMRSNWLQTICLNHCYVCRSMVGDISVPCAVSAWVLVKKSGSNNGKIWRSVTWYVNWTLVEDTESFKMDFSRPIASAAPQDHALRSTMVSISSSPQTFDFPMSLGFVPWSKHWTAGGSQKVPESQFSSVVGVFILTGINHSGPKTLKPQTFTSPCHRRIISALRQLARTANKRINNKEQNIFCCHLTDLKWLWIQVTARNKRSGGR